MLPFFLNTPAMNSKLISYLEGFITEKRRDRFNSILEHRTRYITVALEDLYQPHNASAVLRNCDCFGIQDVHIIENRNKYLLNREVTMGSDKWLNIYKYNTTANNSYLAIDELRKKGYRIVATTPHDGEVKLEDFNPGTSKFALFFGTELKGLSEEVTRNADEFLTIPMFGFTESFNISVSAAIILYTLSARLRESELDWQLSEGEKNEIKLDWLRKSIKDSAGIEREFNLKNSNSQNLII
jgi:tRNA (guanosine-2'-O-)-methyltransferase